MKPELAFLDGGGRMGEKIRAFDWSQTALGPPEHWPAVLKTSIALTLSSKFPKCIVWGPDLITIYNDAFGPILGEKPEALGRPFSEVWREAWAMIGPIAAAAFAGQATFIEDFPLIVERHGYPEQAYFTFCYSPIRDEAGRVVGMMDTVIETTTNVEAAKHVKLINAELEHRMKNTMAVIAAIIAQTFKTTAALPEIRRKIDQRLSALAHAHTVLTQSSWSSAPIREVIEGTLAPHLADKSSVTIAGPPVLLSARHALSLALALNELATNAVKYGALSRMGGRVSIRWTTTPSSGEGPFHFTWVESGGPPVTVPSETGFGSRLIEQIFASDFGGAVTLDYDPAGLRCALVTRMASLQAE